MIEKIENREEVAKTTMLVKYSKNGLPMLSTVKCLIGGRQSKIIITAFALMLFIFSANAQIKVLHYGNVGIGTNSVCNNSVKLQVNDGGNNIAITPSYNGTNIGASIGGVNPTRLDFWHPITQWNKVRFKGYSLSSDSTLKTDINKAKL